MAISKLLGCDPAEVSPAQCGATFSAEAQRIAAEQGVDFPTAWRRAKELHPGIHARMCEKTPSPDAESLANDAGEAQEIYVPRDKKTFLGTMGLPNDTTDAEFSAIVRANGGVQAPLKARSIFPALVAAVARQNGTDVKQAADFVLQKFPDLSDAAGQLSFARPAVQGLAKNFDPRTKPLPVMMGNRPAIAGAYPEAKPFGSGTTKL